MENPTKLEPSIETAKILTLLRERSRSKMKNSSICGICQSNVSVAHVYTILCISHSIDSKPCQHKICNHCGTKITLTLNELLEDNIITTNIIEKIMPHNICGIKWGHEILNGKADHTILGRVLVKPSKPNTSIINNIEIDPIEIEPSLILGD